MWLTAPLDSRLSGWRAALRCPLLAAGPKFLRNETSPKAGHPAHDKNRRSLSGAQPLCHVSVKTGQRQGTSGPTWRESRRRPVYEYHLEVLDRWLSWAGSAREELGGTSADLDLALLRRTGTRRLQSELFRDKSGWRKSTSSRTSKVTGKWTFQGWRVSHEDTENGCLFFLSLSYTYAAAKIGLFLQRINFDVALQVLVSECSCLRPSEAPFFFFFLSPQDVLSPWEGERSQRHRHTTMLCSWTILRGWEL